MTRLIPIERLQESEVSASDLSIGFNRSVSAFEEDFQYIRTSVRNNTKLDLLIRPASCMNRWS